MKTMNFKAKRESTESLSDFAVYALTSTEMTKLFGGSTTGGSDNIHDTPPIVKDNGDE